MLFLCLPFRLLPSVASQLQLVQFPVLPLYSNVHTIKVLLSLVPITRVGD
jgi:hypothetical protein